jgi:membrane protein implicated in regulation of membrane protease activity
MNELLPMLGGWAWWILAGVLLILELLAPGVFLMWLGFAAVAVGLIELIFDMPWQVEIAVFAVLSIVLLVTGRPWIIKRQQEETDQPNLNRRMNEFVGQRFVLAKAIVNGRGQVRIDDTLWEVLGPDLGEGEWVTVTGVNGMRLTVDASPQN